MTKLGNDLLAQLRPEDVAEGWRLTIVMGTWLFLTVLANHRLGTGPPRRSFAKTGCCLRRVSQRFSLELGPWNLGRDETEEEFHRAKAFKEEEDGVREVDG